MSILFPFSTVIAPLLSFCILELTDLIPVPFPLIFKAAEFLSMKTSYLYKLTSARKISHSKPNGKLIYFRRSVLEDYLLSNEIPAICEEQQSNENHWKK